MYLTFHCADGPLLCTAQSSLGWKLCAAMYQLSGGHVVFAPYGQVNSTVHSFRQTKQVATRLTLTQVMM